MAQSLCVVQFLATRIARNDRYDGTLQARRCDMQACSRIRLQARRARER